MGNITRTLSVVLALVSASFGISVSVSSPSANSTVGSPATITASATSSNPITGWRIYVDGNQAYANSATQSIAAPVNMSAGSHQVIVRAWDSTGAYASQNLGLTVGSGGSAPSASGVSVNVTSPANQATVGSPATINATASSGVGISGWRIYVDGNQAYAAGATPTISASVPMGGGTHQVVVRAWNNSGAYGDRTLALNVGNGGTNPTPNPTPAPTGGPTPPANATAYTKLEEATGWGNCRSAGCSGSDAGASYYMAQYQTNPSLDGSSTLFNVSGSAWADVLWYKHVNPVPSATHWLIDFWVKPNADTLTRVEALEFDSVMIVNGRKFDLSNQCHYSGQHWDTWDGLSLKWVHTNIPCPKLDPNKWHHVQILGERVGTQTHNISYTVDGVTRPVPDAYAWHQTRVTAGSGTNTLNMQVQMDTNANAGTISEYIDKLTLYVW